MYLIKAATWTAKSENWNCSKVTMQNDHSLWIDIITISACTIWIWPNVFSRHCKTNHQWLSGSDPQWQAHHWNLLLKADVSVSLYFPWQARVVKWICLNRPQSQTALNTTSNSIRDCCCLYRVMTVKVIKWVYLVCSDDASQTHIQTAHPITSDMKTRHDEQVFTPAWQKSHQWLLPWRWSVIISNMTCCNQEHLVNPG